MIMKIQLIGKNKKLHKEINFKKSFDSPKIAHMYVSAMNKRGKLYKNSCWIGDIEIEYYTENGKYTGYFTEIRGIFNASKTK